MKILLKTLFAGLLALLIVPAAMAQDASPFDPVAIASQRIDAMNKFCSENLALTAEQNAQFTEANKQLLADVKNLNESSISDGDKADQVDKLNEARKTSLRDMLSSSDYEKLQNWQKEEAKAFKQGVHVPNIGNEIIDKNGKLTMKAISKILAL
ncbi:hypothetical protein [Pontibacter sp. G13]|uniref:hypothetical protein n=1 Tax=Pontibacter sp. G13 TaxID=3074898 RepID=UPI0028896783|nr:hypothetical protein [Pontibacter sp. G13]WNJ18933.1 hypothetical protein RJD25_00460 [Pontibacter sp. G13]